MGERGYVSPNFDADCISSTCVVQGSVDLIHGLFTSEIGGHLCIPRQLNFVNIGY